MAVINSISSALDVIKKSGDTALKYHAIWWLGKNKAPEALTVLC